MGPTPGPTLPCRRRGRGTLSWLTLSSTPRLLTLRLSPCLATMTATRSPTRSGGSPLDLAWEEDLLILRVQQIPHSRPRPPRHPPPPRPLKAVAENTALWT